MRFHSIAGALVATSFMVASAAQAATLADATGPVLVNTGGGFRPAPISATLPAGARVMVRNGAEAKVSYSDFCVVVVRPGQVYTVAPASPCGAGGTTTAGNLLPHDYALIAGGVAVGAGVLIYQATKSKSASP